MGVDVCAENWTTGDFSYQFGKKVFVYLGELEMLLSFVSLAKHR